MTLDKRLKELQAYLDGQLLILCSKTFAHRRAHRELALVKSKLDAIVEQGSKVEELTPPMTPVESLAKAREAKAAKAASK